MAQASDILPHAITHIDNTVFGLIGATNIHLGAKYTSKSKLRRAGTKLRALETLVRRLIMFLALKINREREAALSPLHVSAKGAIRKQRKTALSPFHREAQPKRGTNKKSSSFDKLRMSPERQDHFSAHSSPTALENLHKSSGLSEPAHPEPVEGELVIFPRSPSFSFRLTPPFIETSDQPDFTSFSSRTLPVRIMAGRFARRIVAIKNVIEAPEVHAARLARRIQKMKEAKEPAPMLIPTALPGSLPTEIKLLHGGLEEGLRSELRKWDSS